MPPFTVPAVGTTHCCVPVVGRVNCVGPLYAGLSVLVVVGSGWVNVLVGHCTRNDCAAAGSAARHPRAAPSHKADWVMLLITSLPPDSSKRTTHRPTARDS